MLATVRIFIDMGKHLLVLGCSRTKKTCEGMLPAIDRYDGSPYRVVRSFLRDYHWPPDISIGVLSAKHGLFGALKGIEYYDKKMDRVVVNEKALECSTTLRDWAVDHDSVHLSLGKDYLPAVQPALEMLGSKAMIFEGGIGDKLHQIKAFLNSQKAAPRVRVEVEPGEGRMSYFLPDWDDLLDPDFDFDGDSFSGSTPRDRADKHCCVLMQPKRMCDGILVSLAQHETSKGSLRRLDGKEANSLSPVPLRSRFGLSEDQWLFGDCGAFSYVNEDQPSISVDQAVALYDLYGFDFGASVDHIPVTAINQDGVAKTLSFEERRARVETTRTNAELFISKVEERKAQFNPVGTLQGLFPADYAESVLHYHDLGYRHLAVGGLVPRSDSEIESIVREVVAAANKVKRRPWIHLFGIFRPKLQALFRDLRIDSFDSATYFRKAWLRSDQNYLGTNGQWYAALRVPMTNDPRTRKRLQATGADFDRLKHEEVEVLLSLSKYDKGEAAIEEVLDILLVYEQNLSRSNQPDSIRERYRRTLTDKPWKRCDCQFCRNLGIHILVFRGSNRNKRRGAHNTLMLYGHIQRTADVTSI